MCPNSFRVSKVDHLSPRKKWPILVMFFGINFMLCLVLLPKIQPLSKPEIHGAATTLFREKLSHLMLGENGRCSTTFMWNNKGIYEEKLNKKGIMNRTILACKIDPHLKGALIMPRIRQLYQHYANEDFTKALRVGMLYCGYGSFKEVAKAVPMDPRTLYRKVNEPEKFTIAELRELRKVLNLEPDILLALLGFSSKEITRFRKQSTTHGTNASNTDCSLTPQQIEALARPLAYMADSIIEYYKDPEHEAAYQAWYLEKYGLTASR